MKWMIADWMLVPYPEFQSSHRYFEVDLTGVEALLEQVSTVTPISTARTTVSFILCSVARMAGLLAC